LAQQEAGGRQSELEAAVLIDEVFEHREFGVGGSEVAVQVVKRIHGQARWWRKPGESRARRTGSAPWPRRRSPMPDAQRLPSATASDPAERGQFHSSSA